MLGDTGPRLTSMSQHRYELARDRLRKVLKHYLQMGLEAKGWEWGEDNDAEVDGIVNDMVIMTANYLEARK